LVANAVRYGVPLPGRDAKWNERLMVFDDQVSLRGLGTLRIFPLIAGDRVLGTLVAGGKASVLNADTQRTLEVMAIQVAQAILRAQLFEQMERMATTDGLTGLLNHRAFQTRAEEVLAQAKRYGRKCSIILGDIDHFKAVNDTHGHPTGDVVLKGVALLLTQQARDSDVVARYGGEEFAIIMPETDGAGAKAIAERIREAVMRQAFKVDSGQIRVTISLGIATFIDDGADKQAWIDAADQALYHAKRRGRNQSLAASQLSPSNAPAGFSRPLAAPAIG
jgi:diguanylate cyclase (GGDEF)-like protein